MQGHGIAVDSAGNAYVTGYTAFDQLPDRQPPAGHSMGAAHERLRGEAEPGGSALVYSTYLGGSGDDEG